MYGWPCQNCDGHPSGAHADEGCAWAGCACPGYAPVVTAQPCGCPDREGHVNPALDVDLGIGHGERSASCDDPLPHDVPGTGGWNGVYTESPDAYCLCGHPDYRTCWARFDHGLVSLTIERAES